MNKKFSTLVGCLLFGTAFSAVAQQVNFPATDSYTQVQPDSRCGIVYRSFGTNSAALGNEVNAINENKWYQLRVGAGENARVLIQERDFRTGEVTLRLVSPEKAPLNYSLWQISYDKADGVTGGKFSFKNKETGLGIVFDHTTAYDKDEVAVNAAGAAVDASIMEGCNTEWSWFSSNKVTVGNLTNKVLYAQYHDVDGYIVLKETTSTTPNSNGLGVAGNEVIAVTYSAADAGDGATACNALQLTPVEASPVTLSAKDINRMIDAQVDGAAGFNFMTPTGIGNRTEMTPEDNKTLDTYKYIAKEYNLRAEAEKLAKDANAAIIAAGGTVLKEFNAEEGSEAKELVYDFSSWHTGDEHTALKAAGVAFNNDKTATNAKALVESWIAYLNSTKDDLLWDNETNAAYLAKHTDATVVANYDYAAKASTADALALYDQYTIRLNAQIESDVTKNNKYLMVDTARWEEATENPSNSPELKLTNKVPDGKAGIFVDARYNYRMTYYPTQDSLVIEPLNASVMTDAEYKADTYWKNSVIAQNFISSSDLTAGTKGLSASNTTLATNPEEAPVVVMLSKLNTKDGWVVTAGSTDKPKNAPAEGTIHTCIEFDHSYPTLARTTVAEGVYLINLATSLQPDTYSHRVDGTNIVADMKGHVIYDEQEKSQDFTHMPAAQWVVEWVGCKEDNNKGTARVKVVNREYSNVAFEGQMYKASDNKVYIINHDYNNYLGSHGNTQFACSDTLVFVPVEPANTLGYLNPGDQVIENTFKFRQFFAYGEDPYYLNAVKVGSDTLLRAQSEGSNFELIPYEGSKEGTKPDGSKQTVTIPFENIPYGYTSEAAGAPQLYKSIYMLKVKDADKINNDRMFVGVNKNGKYCVADTLDAKSPEYTVAYFALKENNHWPIEEADNHYYSLVQVYNPEKYCSVVYNEETKEFEVKYNITDDVKLAIEQGQLDAKQEDLCQDRTEAFALEVDTMPYYRRLAGLEYTEFYSVNNNNRVLFEKEGFMSIHSTAEETADNKLYVDTAWVSGTSMPTYLLARDVNKFITDTCQHGDHPEASAHWRKVEYLQGRYMIDLGSIDAKAIPSYVDTKPYAQMYSKYAFVNAIHMADTLYIMKAATDSIKYQHELTIDKKKVQYALPMNKEALNGASVAFRLKNHENDVTKGEFYVETMGKKYGYALDGNAWMKEQNNNNIVSTASGESVDHNHEWKITNFEDIYQALLLDTDAKGGATANDKIETPSSISVVAGNGELVVKGAAGKTITVINTLGTTIAKTVASSDEEKVNVPAGFVVVSVEGEAAVKAIVK